MYSLDKSLYYLAEAEYYSSLYEPIGLDDYLSEAADEKSETNDKATKGFIESIKKVFETIIEGLKSLIEKIGNFFKGEYLTKEHKEKIKEIKDVISKNPEVGKIPVEGFYDYDEIEKEFKEAEKELETEYKKNRPLKEKADDIFNKLNQKIDIIKKKAYGTATKAAGAYTLSTAVDIADRNVSLAKGLNFLIKNDIVELDALRKKLGDDFVDDAEKKIEAYSNASWFHRMKMKLRTKHLNTMKGVMLDQVMTVVKFTNLKWWKAFKLKDDEKLIDAESIAKGFGTRRARKKFGSAADDIKAAADTVNYATKKTKETVDDIKSFFK